MQSAPNIDRFIPESLTKFAYQSFQEGKKNFGVAHKTMSNRLTNMVVPERPTKRIRYV